MTAEFAVAGVSGSVPTRQSGDCERIAHSAHWSQTSHDRWSAEEVKHFQRQHAAYLASLSDADWQRLLDDHFCIDDICSRLPANPRDE